ncbi:hypothetical protein [Cohnella fermenti]|uniref:PepSY domain-containing protein n=1 Tax=Cohnella fermenti TaxID=2565925 RepID=A0A4S4BLV1_9BACL|nr:hypothetical protein [Cohnella fermenti]THF75761.1 hypothetical protein E6C55_21145 [Cohnella fermenti]
MNLIKLGTIAELCLILLLTAGCSKENNASNTNQTNAEAMSTEQIEQAATDYFAQLNKPGVSITSIAENNGAFVVRWERPSNCEEGKLFMNKRGEVTSAELSIC